MEWWNGLLKTKLQHKLGGNTLQDWGKVLQKMYMLESVTNTWCCFFLGRIHEFKNQVMKMEEVPLTVIPSDLLANFCFLFLWLCSAGLNVLVPKEWKASTKRHNNNYIELKIKTASQPLCVPHACESTGKKRVSLDHRSHLPRNWTLTP